jgi:hypothetical protein
MIIFLVILGIICTMAFNSNSHIDPNKTFEAYKYRHPEWNKKGRLACHNCDGTVFWMIRAYGSIYAHTCRTCGEKLYYTSKDHKVNRAANEQFKLQVKSVKTTVERIAPEKKRKTFVLKHKGLTVSILLIAANFGAMFFLDKVNAMVVHFLTIQIVMLGAALSLAARMYRFVFKRKAVRQ